MLDVRVDDRSPRILLWSRHIPHSVETDPNRLEVCLASRVPVVRALLVTGNLSVEDWMQSVAIEHWAGSLKRNNFGGAFDGCIAGVAWPTSIRMLSFGREFNQPVNDMV